MKGQNGQDAEVTSLTMALSVALIPIICFSNHGRVKVK